MHRSKYSVCGLIIILKDVSSRIDVRKSYHPSIHVFCFISMKFISMAKIEFEKKNKHGLSMAKIDLREK